MTGGWPAGPATPALSADEVHVWALPLDPPPAALERLGRLLAPDERARAARFRFERDRRRYVAGRARLRELLGRYLGADPAILRFAYGPQGKPALAGTGDLRFNLSNSADRAVVALTLGRELGVDLEFMAERLADGGVARRFFAPAEVEALGRLPGERWLEGFFHCWTRKEAYLKALGSGLAAPLDGFEVAVGPDEPPRLVRVHADPAEAARWSMAALAPAPGYIGAVIVEGSGWRLRCWEWAG